MDVFDRYEPLIDDFEAFREACERPLPTAVRVNEIATDPDRARAVLDESGIEYERAGWQSGVFRLATDRPGATWGSFRGFWHGQEEVSAIPAPVLDPQPGERVWAACAAPGSKASHLAARMDDTGTLVANDRNLGRLSALRFNLERLGVTCAVVTNRDARNFSLKPFGFEAFDRTLVDAPCSCEGTIRKNPDALDNWSEEYLQSVSALQKSILERAIQATNAGGTVVYSTCTFAPEENEAVLDRLLDRENCEVVPFTLDMSHEPGITEWRDNSYDPSLRNTKRVYPHLNDTGGFFCAKLEVGK